MKEIIYFKTYSYGGIDNNLVETRSFETPDLAKADALKDTWNINFHLYEVTMIFDGVVTEKEKSLGRIVCGRDLQNFKEKGKTKKI